MIQTNAITAIESRLWNGADNLRANSSFSSNEYFLPVMGLIFLRHAYSRYLHVKTKIESDLASLSGEPRPLSKEDFAGKGAPFLRPEAQFDYLLSLSNAEDRVQAIIHAMEIIEEDYEGLRGVLPKQEYRELDNDVLGNLLNTFNDPALKSATGDVFGRIYEYFLTGFADQKAHDGGEFFTPFSIVQMIVNVIEPDHGKIIDPACGSGGMFVQSAHFIEKMHENPQELATFFGMEKNPTTIRLAKMNLAVHGLDGKIAKAISYYEEPHQMVGKCDFVMANPPFNVDEVDAEKVKNDPRLPFGLPKVNKRGQVSNGNYLWISYFYAYLNDKGRAGFVTSAQASSAGGEEARVRRRIIETGHVDAVITIRRNFFYTRSIPCELWFFDKGKPKAMENKVLMVDARETFRKVTRRIFDFSPEQIQNLSAIFWLYRGRQDRYLDLLTQYLQTSLDAARQAAESVTAFLNAHDSLTKKWVELDEEAISARAKLQADAKDFALQVNDGATRWHVGHRTNDGLAEFATEWIPLAEKSQDLIKQIEHAFNLIEKQVKAQSGRRRVVNKLMKVADIARRTAIDELRQIGFFHGQARWLQERFPEAKLCDVDGLVKLVDHTEIEEHDWSLNPGRYVGVAPEEMDLDFDFEETLRTIHVELSGLNREAAALAAQIQKNFKELGL